MDTEPVCETRREIVSRFYEDGVHRYTGRESIPGEGDIHRVWSVEGAAAEAKQDRATLNAAIEAVQDRISRTDYIALADAANTLDTSIRMEAIARLITAAQQMIDFAIAVFVVPPPEPDDGEEGDER